MHKKEEFYQGISDALVTLLDTLLNHELATTIIKSIVTNIKNKYVEKINNIN